jgi:hypothetical protein
MHFISILSIILSALECARGLTGDEGDVGFTGYGAIYWPCYTEDQRALNSYNTSVDFFKKFKNLKIKFYVPRFVVLLLCNCGPKQSDGFDL